MRVKPFIVGSGMSGKAIAKALAVIDIVDPDITVEAPTQLRRGQPLAGLADGHEQPVLCICNPHGLHARCVTEAQRAGFRAIILDKPPCVNLDELAALRRLAAECGDDLAVAVLHGYRQMWGPQRMREMIAAGELGDLIAIEGTYWQSSAAELAVATEPRPDKAWKSDVSLGGPTDTYVDLGTHWVDLMMFLAGGPPESARTWLSHVNAPAPNRDTHVHIYLQFPACRSLGSASKTVHGGNHLDVSVWLEGYTEGRTASCNWAASARCIGRSTTPMPLRLPTARGRTAPAASRGNQVTYAHHSAISCPLSYPLQPVHLLAASAGRKDLVDQAAISACGTSSATRCATTISLQTDGLGGLSGRTGDGYKGSLFDPGI